MIGREGEREGERRKEAKNVERKKRECYTQK